MKTTTTATKAFQGTTKVIKMKKMKLTTIQKRAKHFCDRILANNEGSINVEWKKSNMWGMNPVILSGDGKCTNIGGCGYDKLSACLSEVLCFLVDPDKSDADKKAFNNILACNGCGVPRLEAVLLTHGWKLERIATGTMFDCYLISKI